MNVDNFKFSSHYPHSEFHHRSLHRLAHRLQRLNQSLNTFHTKLNQRRNQRLTVGIGAGVSAVLFMFIPQWKFLGWVFLFLFPAFFFLVRWTSQLQEFSNFLSLKIDFYKRQLHKVQGHHAYSNQIPPIPETGDDLNLFGSPSLFDMLDECFSIEGSQQLANRLIQPKPQLKEILETQKRIKKLAQHRWTIERFLLEGQKSLQRLHLSEIEKVLKSPLIGSGYLWSAILHLLLFPGYIIVFFMIGYGYINLPLALPIVLYAVFALSSLKSVTASFSQAEGTERSLGSVIPIISWLEKHPKIFEEYLEKTRSGQFSQRIKPLQFYVSMLSLQSHGLAFLIVNALCPWTLLFAGLSEHWRKKNKEALINRLHQIQRLEADASLVLIYCYQSHTFPEFSETTIVDVQNIYHPLIPREQVRSNSVRFGEKHSMLLLTGSNMSGKSTFLRTLGVNHTLALAGAPVFATSMTTFCGPLVTAIQIKDSLDQGYSYFYAEVKKVKEIIKRAQAGENFLFFIDEIFKGTNNRERLIGSRSVIRALSRLSNVTGIISTHDLELTSLAKEHSSIVNYHFRDEVVDGELRFSYQLYEGPCPTTNALKIMELEGLPVDSSAES